MSSLMHVFTNEQMNEIIVDYKIIFLYLMILFLFNCVIL